MLAILDNKSFAGKFVKDVSALMRNLVTNLRDDARELRFLAKRFPDTPPDFVMAAGRMERAAAEIEMSLAGAVLEKGLPEKVQKEIADILVKYHMRLLVTNVGGQAEKLTPELQRLIKFWNVQKTGELPWVP
jgi:hypothetical protein